MGVLMVRRQRRMLRGWLKWIPVIAIPFSVLFVHAWFNVQILRADYVLRELDKEAKQLHDEWLHAGVVEAVQQNPEILAAQADQLAFVQPKPGQREIIFYDPAELILPPSVTGFTMAQGEPVELTPDSPTPSRPVTERQIAQEAVTIPVELSEPVVELLDLVPVAPAVQLELDDEADEVFMIIPEAPESVPVVTESIPLEDGQLEVNMGTLEVL